MSKAILIPTQMEIPRLGYKWVPAYKVISPEGNEIQPYFRVRSTKFEEGASTFCKRMGWKYEICNG